jgi:ORF6N domain
MRKEIVPVDQIAHRIRQLRGEKVLLDYDLAALYGVAVKVLHQAVKRNRKRFPNDFMFQLTDDEARFFRPFPPSIRDREVAQHQQAATNWSQFVASEEIAAILEAIRQLMAPPEKPRREIGFHVRETPPRYRVTKPA